MAKYIPIVLPFCSGLFRVSPMLRHGLLDALDTFQSLCSRTQPTVKPAPAIWHRRTLTWHGTPILCPAACRFREVARRVAIFQDSKPLLMGCYRNFLNPCPY
jgi:hypothetical protein